MPLRGILFFGRLYRYGLHHFQGHIFNRGSFPELPGNHCSQKRAWQTRSHAGCVDSVFCHKNSSCRDLGVNEFRHGWGSEQGSHSPKEGNVNPSASVLSASSGVGLDSGGTYGGDPLLKKFCAGRGRTFKRLQKKKRPTLSSGITFKKQIRIWRQKEKFNHDRTNINKEKIRVPQTSRPTPYPGDPNRRNKLTSHPRKRYPQPSAKS